MITAEQFLENGINVLVKPNESEEEVNCVIEHINDEEFYLATSSGERQIVAFPARNEYEIDGNVMTFFEEDGSEWLRLERVDSTDKEIIKTVKDLLKKTNALVRLEFAEYDDFYNAYVATQVFMGSSEDALKETNDMHKTFLSLPATDIEIYLFDNDGIYICFSNKIGSPSESEISYE